MEARHRAGPHCLPWTVRSPDEWARQFGERRARKGQRLTVEAVEVLSHGRFKPEALTSYERGDRALTVEKAAELAGLYGAPLGDLLEP
jgi:hypothetical protein